uniref:CUE domain-containing protein n=1 Tax=Ananas comosus var. bracteatus TaxID=296719 RepID=A0A6V7Q5A8_ANACO|nr:unnamed protein product [Ananas comosus var. bracteatus]
MTEGKSLLNPYASPYIPLSRNPAGKTLEKENKAVENVPDDPEKKEGGDRPSEHHLQDSLLEEFDKLSFSAESSSKVDLSSGYDDPFYDSEFVDVGDLDIAVESISLMFPNISLDSIAVLLHANGYNPSQTINVLEQLEYGDDGFEDVAEPSESCSHLDNPPVSQASKPEDSCGYEV